MVHIAISPDATRYLLRKAKRPNVVIYRDVFSATRGFLYIPRVRAARREPSGHFEPSSHTGITVWVEKEFLRQLSPGESIYISLDRGLIKSLKVEMDSERIRQIA